MLAPANFIIECNNEKDVVIGQIKENMGRGVPRLMLKRAVVVGGAPSINARVEEIRKRKNSGWDVFALNNAHDWLLSHKINPTHCILYDSRPLMADMVKNTWRHSIHYLISSQCHPSVFNALGQAKVSMFHSHNYDEAMELFRENEPGAHVLCGGLTVGIQSLNIMAMLGYRMVELYGFDSSWTDGKKHVYFQAANDGQPSRTFYYKDKEYETSGPMAAQADSFRENYQLWKDYGIQIRVVGEGLLPDIWKDLEGISDGELEKTEPKKYEAMWNQRVYRYTSSGERLVPEIVNYLSLEKGQTVLDFGCGTGRASLRLQDMGFHPIGIDFAINCLDKHVKIPFCIANLWELPENLKGDHGICCDVMEHIPEEKINEVLNGIKKAVSGKIFFKIDFEPDHLGQLINKKLHLTVKPKSWWEYQLSKHWNNVDTPQDGVFIVSN